MLHVVGQLLHVAGEAHNDPVTVAHMFVVHDLRAVLLKGAANIRDRALDATVMADAIARAVPLPHQEAQPELARLGILVEREPGRIRAPVLAAVQHVDQRLTRRQTRVTVLEHHARYPAHARRSHSVVPKAPDHTMNQGLGAPILRYHAPSLRKIRPCPTRRRRTGSSSTTRRPGPAIQCSSSTNSLAIS